MKHLLTGVAVVAALAFAAPVWAQGVSPSGGNSMGTPGPNPGGPGLTPYSGGAPYTGGARTTAAPPPSAPPAAMAPSAGAAPSETSSAMPPAHHRHARHASHGKMAGQHRGRGPELTGTSANQLNQEELSRLQAGNMSTPPVVPAPTPLPGPGAAPPRSQPMGTTGGGAPYRP